MGLARRWETRLQQWEETLPGHSWRRAREVDLPTQTLALAAQFVLCAAPLLVAISAVVRRAGGKGLGPPIARYLGLHGDAGNDVMSLFTAASNVSMTSLVLGMIVALLFVTGVAATQQRGYEGIWSLPRTSVRASWRQLLWVFGLVIYIAIILNAGRLGHHGQGRVHSGVVFRAIPQFIASLLFYAWSQHLLLGGRITWKRVMPGAVCMSLGTTILVVVSAVVLPGQLTQGETDYGPVGATFVLSVWLVVLSAVIFGGGLLGAVIVERRERPTPNAPAEAGGEPEDLRGLKPGSADAPDGLGVHVTVGDQLNRE